MNTPFEPIEQLLHHWYSVLYTMPCAMWMSSRSLLLSLYNRLNSSISKFCWCFHFVSNRWRCVTRIFSGCGRCNRATFTSEVWFGMTIAWPGRGEGNHDHEAPGEGFQHMRVPKMEHLQLFIWCVYAYACKVFPTEAHCISLCCLRNVLESSLDFHPPVAFVAQRRSSPAYRVCHVGPPLDPCVPVALRCVRRMGRDHQLGWDAAHTEPDDPWTYIRIDGMLVMYMWIIWKLCFVLIYCEYVYLKEA